MKRQEREYAKEKQKLVKDKDAGPLFSDFMHKLMFNRLCSLSQDAVDQGEPDEDQDGESG